MGYVIDGGRNILGQVDNAGYQHFPLFTKCFQRFSSSGLKLCGKGLISIHTCIKKKRKTLNKTNN